MQVCTGDCYSAMLNLAANFSTYAYSTDLIPMKSDGNPLPLYVLFAIGKLISLDNSGILTLAGSMILNWNDNRRTWRKEDNSNLIYLQVATKDVWTPILTLLNPAGTPTMFPVNLEPTWIDSYGNVTTGMNYVFKAACGMDLTYFPYDIQTCDLEFTDINYWFFFLIYLPSYQNVSMSFYIPSADWTILSGTVSSASKQLDVGGGNYNSYATLRVRFVFQRNWFYYSMTLVFPTVLLEMLQLFAFALPHGAQLKVTLSASLLLTMYVLQRQSMAMLPSFDNEKYPRFVLGLNAGMLLGAIALVASVVSVTLCQLDIVVPERLRRWLAVLFRTQSKVCAKNVSVCRELADDQEPGAVTGAEGDEQVTCASTCCSSDKVVYYLRKISKHSQDKLAERRKAVAMERARKLNSKAWEQIECLFSIVMALIYFITSVYYIATCLVQV